jgi:hypothetical protein
MCLFSLIRDAIPFLPNSVRTMTTGICTKFLTGPQKNLAFDELKIILDIVKAVSVEHEELETIPGDWQGLGQIQTDERADALLSAQCLRSCLELVQCMMNNFQ